jgi:hypothetical protein
MGDELRAHDFTLEASSVSFWTNLFGRERATDLRRRLTLERLDGRDMPSASPATPPETPPVVVTPPTNSAYAQYVATAGQAYQQYNTEDSAALAEFDAAIDVAFTQLESSLRSAWNAARPAADQIVTTANSSIQSSWSNFLAAYDAAYVTFTAAWQSAAGNQAALDAAVDTFNATAEAAYNQAIAAIEQAVQAAQPAIASLQAQLDTVADSAAVVWDAAVGTATAAYHAREQTAWTAYTAAEQTAWDVYLTAAPMGQPLDPRLLQPKPQKPGPILKWLPDNIKVETDPLTRKTKITLPHLVEIDLQKVIPIPGAPKIKGFAPFGQYDPLAPPGKPSVTGGIGFQFTIEFPVFKKPRR